MNHFEIIETRVAQVRAELAMMELDAFIVPHDDEHLGEYIPAYAERLDWITGFNGSAGLAIILAQRAALFIDGRYTVQARMQAPAELFEFLHLVEDPHVQWLADQLPSGSRVGFDARLHSLAWYHNAKAVLTERGIVYLMGIVNEREAKVAIAVARTTAGVVKVVNVLEVVGEDETRRLDNQVLGARKAPPPSAPVENR